MAVINSHLYEKIHPNNTIHRAMHLIIMLLLCFLLSYRVFSLKDNGLPWFLALLCETCFTFTWLLVLTIRWTPLHYKTYPQTLRKRVDELPQVDMFVTTADPILEPPIVTVNSVLSLLAIDYPADKLACYVSDDACSPLNFYALVEASKFAKLWVPFCKKYSVQVRAPFKYFSQDPLLDTDSGEFQQEFKTMKNEYERLGQNIDAAGKKFAVSGFDLTGDFSVFSNTERGNHPSIIKIIWENREGLSDGIPHLVYISREKRPEHPHHFKAGAMNVLTRVSGLMTNAPFMLNVDCDVFVNNPELVYEATCLLLGSNKTDFGFVQFPQEYHDNPTALAFLNEYFGKGIVGIQGPFYYGTGCFHRRKVIYGAYPDDTGYENGKLYDVELQKRFGNTKQFIQSATQALEGSNGFQNLLSNSLDEALEVASSDYEYSTSWGEKVGWIYGSIAEDSLTGITIHKRGWKSGYCDPSPPGFLGSAPTDSLNLVIQQKRWVTGFLEILFSKNNPISATLNANLQFRQGVAYLWFYNWGLRSIPELCYATLPAYCIFSNSNFLPKDPGMNLLPLVPFLVYNLYTLWKYIRLGLSIREWWIDRSMNRIVTITSWTFGVINGILKGLGLMELGFEITEKAKYQSTASDEQTASTFFIFDESPSVVLGTTIVLIHLIGLAFWLLGLQAIADGKGSGLGEVLCSVIVVMLFLPYVEGLFRKGKYGIKSGVLCKSTALAFLFASFCKMQS